MKTEDKYKEPEIFNFPGVVVKVYRPILTDEERIRRMNTIHNQAANLLKKAN